jgi:predicted phage terminase large subunit-like protein
MVAQLRDEKPPIYRIRPVAEYDSELARRHLQDFVEQAWPTVEPGTRYVRSWYVGAICDHLEAVLRGEIRNLLINMPPRMMKSLTVSVFFPAWAWITRPELRFLYSSYAQSLATDHSVATRRVIESAWYQERWADRYQLAGDQNLKTRFDNTARGYRYATGVGGVGTGLGGDVVVCDDPHNVKQAESDTIRAATLEWWDKTMSTRLNDPKTGARIIVMQRVHEKDLSGHVLAQGGYEHLCLPMEYEPTQYTTVLGWKDPREESGELLAPDRFGEAELVEAKLRLGTYGYAGQMQQRPAPAEGGVLKTPWWGRYADLPITEFNRAAIFVDSAFKDGVANDWSVFALWAATGNGSSSLAYLINIWRKRVQFPELIRLGETAHAWATDLLSGVTAIPLIVEDKASGQSAIQQWKADKMIPVIAHPVPPGSTKESRVDAISPLVEAGRAFIPKGGPAWLAEWLLEHERFPKGDHDDQVDTTSMALARLLATINRPNIAPVEMRQASTWRSS